MAASKVATFSRRGLLTGLTAGAPGLTVAAAPGLTVAAMPGLTMAAMPGAAQTPTAEIAAQRAQAQLKRRSG